MRESIFKPGKVTRIAGHLGNISLESAERLRIQDVDFDHKWKNLKEKMKMVLGQSDHCMNEEAELNPTIRALTDLNK